MHFFIDMFISLSEVESSKTSLALRTHFEVLGFGLEAYKSWFSFFGGRLINFFGEHLHLVPLASRGSVLKKSILGLGLEMCVLDSTSEVYIRSK